MSTLLERAQHDGTPLIDGTQVTFVWQGEIAPQLMGDFTYWGAGLAELTEAEPDVWTYTLKLPEDAYIEYAYFQNGERVHDGFNTRTVSNGMGGMNQYFYMPGAVPTPLAQRRRGIPHGRMTHTMLNFSVPLARGKRQLHLYQPPVAEPCPLVVVLDGQDYLHRAHLPTIVDNLIYEKRIRPIALAMLEHGGDVRFTEYMCSDATLGMLIRDLLPVAYKRLGILDYRQHPGAYGILGASMGGLMSLYAGVRVPEVFGHVLSQSGAFAFSFQDTRSVIYDLIQYSVLTQHDSVNRPHIYMDAGNYEWLISANDSMYQQLKQLGYDVTYHRYSAGHNYTAWQNDVSRGLETLFARVP